jgi:starch synthase
MAAIQCDVPLIVSFRGSDFDLRAFGPSLAHLQAAAQAARACSCLNASSGRLITRLLRPPCPVRVIPNHVDPAEFTPDVAIDLPYPHPLIATVGVFRRLTGLDFLLRAFDHLAAHRAGSLALIGPFQPIEAYHYSALIDDLTHGRRVHRIGCVPHAEILAYMTAADLLVFPATSDGCPSKVLEAMLAGRAIVASNIGGIPELLRDGTDGILVDPRDPKQLADAIEGLLDDPERRRRYGESARTRASSVFSPARRLADWLECYRDAGL